MNIKISDIKDYGNLDKERVVLNVLSDVDLGKYVLSSTVELPDNRISANINNIYWLPDQILKTGDMIVIYTKKGERSNRQNEDGTTTYFFYWGLTEPLGKDSKKGIVLFETTWTYRKVVPDQSDSEVIQPKDV